MQVTLDKNNITNLLGDNIIRLNEDSTIEILSNKLVVNNNGTIYSLENATLYFEKRKIEQEFKIIFLKKLLCEHLNLEPQQILFTADNIDDTTFRINFFPDKEIYIIVCHQQSATLNSKEFYPYDTFDDNNQIGPYKRLGTSTYYFRWSDFD